MYVNVCGLHFNATYIDVHAYIHMYTHTYTYACIQYIRTYIQYIRVHADGHAKFLREQSYYLLVDKAVVLYFQRAQ